MGHSSKIPEVGLEEQSLDPPPQFGIPEAPTREAPIIRMTVPVTMGGKIFLRMRGETNDMKISRKEQIRDVPERICSELTPRHNSVGHIDTPSTFPYASGQGPLVTVPSAAVVDGQVPSAYIALKIYESHERRSSTRKRATDSIRGAQCRKACPDHRDQPSPKIIITKQSDSRHLYKTQNTFQVHQKRLSIQREWRRLTTSN